MSSVLRARGRHCAPPRRRGAHRAPARPAPRRTATVGATTVLAIGVIGGGAYAFWSGMATGDAKAQAATANVLGVGVGSAGTDLFPGATTNVNFVLSNSNAYPVSLDTLTSASVTSSDPTACPSSNITLASTGGLKLPSAITVPAGSTSTGGTLSNFATMASTAPDSCQGKTFTVSLSFSGMQTV